MTISKERLNILQQTFKATAKTSETLEAAALNDAAAAISELLAVRGARSVPVAWQQRFSGDHWQSCSKSMFDYLSENPDPIVEVREVYAAPPAPAVNNLISVAQRLVGRYIANKGTTSEFIACVTPEKLSIGTGGTWDDWRLLDAALNACRAAMLQSCDAVRDLSTPVDPQIAEYEQALDMVGMSVSVDVSTSDDNAGYRYFGRITEVQQSANPKDKGGVVLLVQDDVESNFDDGIAPDGYKLMPIDMTDDIGEAIAMEANCCGGIALDIYNAAMAAAPTPTK